MLVAKPLAIGEQWPADAITMQASTLNKIKKNMHAKGDVLACARLAGIMAAKKTAELIPLCHPLILTAIDMSFRLNAHPAAVDCTATVKTHERTGVEMEALTAVQVALLTIYDMCKAVDRGMHIDDVRLLEKTGGRSGNWCQPTYAGQQT